jgi:orotate phosphoribosyltransferase-like protein
MTNYREILRLSEMGLSRASIGTALGYSRNTVSPVFQTSTSAYAQVILSRIVDTFPTA